MNNRILRPSNFIVINGTVQYTGYGRYIFGSYDADELLHIFGNYPEIKGYVFKWATPQLTVIIANRKNIKGAIHFHPNGKSSVTLNPKNSAREDADIRKIQKIISGELICVEDFCSQDKGDYWADYDPINQEVLFGGNWQDIPNWKIGRVPTSNEVWEHADYAQLQKSLLGE